MAWFKRQKLADQKAGQVISAQALADAGNAIGWLSGITAAPPLEMLATADGPLIRYPGAIFEAYLVVTSSTISARSGGTPGTGTATVLTWDGTALASLGVDFTVLSISSTTGGIPSGTYGIMMKIAGAYWFTTLDCGN